MEGRVNRDKSRNFDASEPREPNRGHLSPPVMTIDELNKLKSEVLRLELASKQGEALAAESRYNKEKSRYDAAIVSKARCEQRLSRRELVAQRYSISAL